MERTIAQLLGSLAGIGAVFVVVAVFTLAVAWPLMLFSITRSLKGIRRELVTLNETISNKLPM